MSTLFSFSTIGLADQALDFMDIVRDTIGSHLPIFLLICVPFILLIILNIIHCVDYDKYKKESKIALLIMFTMAYGVTFVYLLPVVDSFSQMTPNCCCTSYLNSFLGISHFPLYPI